MGMNFDHFDKIIRHDHPRLDAVYLNDLLFCRLYK